MSGKAEITGGTINTSIIDMTQDEEVIDTTTIHEYARSPKSLVWNFINRNTKLMTELEYYLGDTDYHTTPLHCGSLRKTTVQH